VSSGAQAHDDPGPRDAHSALSSADALLGGGVRRILQIQAGGDYCDTDELTFPLLVDETDALLGGGVRRILQIQAGGDDSPKEILRYRRIDVPAIG
jgi:hypothetical protein